MTDYIGVRKAAKALGLNPSTVSRYLDNYPELNHAAAGARPEVDLAELRQHRADNVNGLKSGNHAGLFFDEAEEDQAAAETERSAAEAGNPKSAYTKAKAEREQIAARRAKIELDEILGAVTPTDEVNDAVFSANQVLQDGLLNIRRELSERLVGMTDAAEIEALLRQEHRAALEGFAKEFKKLFERETQNAA